MFLHGCNYPWSTDGASVYYGMDFGASVWGSHTGVSTRRPQIAADFAQMASLGFTVVRWFVFADGRSGIEYDDRGLPAGPDSHLFTDLDAALSIARDVDIRLVLVLLDHRWMFEGIPDVIADPLTGALLEARLQTAVDAGCDLAMMVAAPGSASQRNAERQGFRIAYTRTKWQL